jgi:hypothetical protein
MPSQSLYQIKRAFEMSFYIPFQEIQQLFQTPFKGLSKLFEGCLEVPLNAVFKGFKLFVQTCFFLMPF